MNEKKRRQILFLSVAAFIFFILSFLQPGIDSNSGRKKFFKQLSEDLHSKEQLATSELAKLETLGDFKKEDSQHFISLTAKHQITFLAYRKDSLLFWSDNLTEIPNNKIQSGLVKLNNSIYEVITKTTEDRTLLALIRITEEYPYANSYLESGPAKGFSFPKGTRFAEQGEFELKSISGEKLMSVSFPLEGRSDKDVPWLLLIALFLFLTIQFLIGTTSISLLKRSLWIIFMTLPSICFLFLDQPSGEMSSGLFNPAVYSSSYFFPSLGVLILKSAVTASVIILLLTLFREKKPYGLIASSLASVVITFLAWAINSLVQDSSIPLELSSLLSLNAYSFIVLTYIIALLLFVIYLLKEVIRQGWRLSIHGMMILCLPVLLSFFISMELASSAAAISAAALASVFSLKARERFLVPDLLAILILSVPFAFLLEEEVEHKHFRVLKSEAESLASARDPVLEFLFADLNKKISADESFKNAVLNKERSKEDILLLFRHRFLKGYWNKFDISVSSYDTICNSIHQWGTQDRLPLFEQIINEEGQMVDEGLFYYQDLQSGRAFYLGKIELSVTGTLCGVMYLEFNPLYFPEQPGYPELLMNKQGKQELNFSWARYQNERLMASAGRQSFPLTIKADTLEHDQLEQLNNSYRFVLKTPGQIVITTIPEENLLQKAGVFSFLFLLCLGVYLLALPFFGSLVLPVLQTQSFRSRIYLAFFALTFCGLGLAAYASYFFIKRQDELKNRELIEDKMQTALSGFTDISENLLQLDPVLNPFLDLRVDKVANDLRTDINLYDLKGNLLAASSPAIFNEKLLNRKMEPGAFSVLNAAASSLHIQEEKLGKLNYLSGYMPLTTPSGKILGFLNLPYFSAEKELQEDISSVVQALLSIYMLLFLTSMVLAGFISNRLSGPLKLLQERLSALNLLGENRQLSWKHDDEIGALIKQYNKMVVKLSDSAERLAMSERENAWKEMARQVAHEIKNPLTPMKLSVQHLQKAVKEKAPDIDQRIDRFTANLVEQIETLSRIASEFSDFARLPEAQKEIIDLRIFIPGIVETFRNDSEYDIHFDSAPIVTEVLADRAQLIRVFNNLLKNSIQAFKRDVRGSIEISLSRQDSMILISLTDNGSGMSQEISAHVFTPKFTTKSGGMGLGLSMVRSIVENHGGTISFESAEGKGCTFYILLPAAK